jgi:hypothetical protein
MRIPAAVLAAAMVVALCSLARAEEAAVPLALKFAVGDAAQYEVTLSGSGGLRSPDGETASVSVRGSLLISSRVVEMLPDGSARLEVRMPRASIQATIGQQEARFSYENGQLRWFANGREHTPPDADSLKLPLLDSPALVVVSPDGRLTDVGTADPQFMGMIASLPGASGGLVHLGGQPLLPAQPVRVGETWRQSSQLMPLGPSMVVSVTASRTLDSYAEQAGVGLARIAGYSEARVRGVPAVPAEGVSLSLPEIRQTMTSTEFFDTTRGRLLRGDYDLTLRAEVSFDTGRERGSGGADARMHIAVQAR